MACVVANTRISTFSLSKSDPCIRYRLSTYLFVSVYRRSVVNVSNLYAFHHHGICVLLFVIRRCAKPECNICITVYVYIYTCILYCEYTHIVLIKLEYVFDYRVIYSEREGRGVGVRVRVEMGMGE